MSLTDPQQRRADVLTRLISGSITATRAAQLLGVTDRQIRRLRIVFENEGLPSIAHGNRGRKPARTLAPEVAEQIWALAGPGGALADFNVCHLCDVLAQEHGVAIGRSTLQRLLQQRREPPKAARTPKPPPTRQRRLRSGAQGMMVQIDGSPHDWLEGRAPRMCLMGGIDDATNAVLHLRFHPTECAAAYLTMFQEIARLHGLPMSYYHDKHTILRSPKKATIEDDLDGIAPMSHVQKVLHDLGVESIAAHSPQAKGRVERLWQTLQDRLVKEMRLAQIETLEAANAFLPAFLVRFNARFTIEAMDPSSAWVTLEAETDWDFHFSLQDTRIVKADHTLSFGGQVLQITARSRTRSLAGQSVSVRTTSDHRLCLYDGTRRLEYTLLPARPTAPTVRATAQEDQKAAPRKQEPPKASAKKGRTAKQSAYLFAGS